MTKLHDLPPDAIDAALADWRQGDCVVDGEHWFIHRGEEARKSGFQHEQSDKDSPELLESEVEGFVILTQSCDVVRKWSERPFVIISPLVAVDPNDLSKIKRGQVPKYAFIDGVSDKNLVGDLDRVMTIEKKEVATWPRIIGCSTDEHKRAFSQAVPRKHSRFAFPDEFNFLVRRLRARLQEKHDKITAEGEALRGLREIRVRAAPSWEASEVELMFWFIREEEPASQSGAEESLLSKWLGLIPPFGRFKKVEGVIVALDYLTARDYVESDRLDLDHLSG